MSFSDHIEAIITPDTTYTRYTPQKPRRKPKVSNQNTQPRVRQFITPEQEAYLEQKYNKNIYPTKNVRTKISNAIHLSERTVTVWFQNRRRKDALLLRPIVKQIKNGLKKDIKVPQDSSNLEKYMILAKPNASEQQPQPQDVVVYRIFSSKAEQNQDKSTGNSHQARKQENSQQYQIQNAPSESYITVEEIDNGQFQIAESYEQLQDQQQLTQSYSQLGDQQMLTNLNTELSPSISKSERLKEQQVKKTDSRQYLNEHPYSMPVSPQPYDGLHNPQCLTPSSVLKSGSVFTEPYNYQDPDSIEEFQIKPQFWAQNISQAKYYQAQPHGDPGGELRYQQHIPNEVYDERRLSPYQPQCELSHQHSSHSSHKFQHHQYNNSHTHENPQPLTPTLMTNLSPPAFTTEMEQYQYGQLTPPKQNSDQHLNILYEPITPEDTKNPHIEFHRIQRPVDQSCDGYQFPRTTNFLFSKFGFDFCQDPAQQSGTQVSKNQHQPSATEEYSTQLDDIRLFLKKIHEAEYVAKSASGIQHTKSESNLNQDKETDFPPQYLQQQVICSNPPFITPESRLGEREFYKPIQEQHQQQQHMISQAYEKQHSVTTCCTDDCDHLDEFLNELEKRTERTVIPIETIHPHEIGELISDLALEEPEGFDPENIDWTDLWKPSITF